MSKTANMLALFPCGDSMFCIIDDREDVPNFAPNLVHAKPYLLFKNTDAINAPPGLAKKENGEKVGVDFDNIKEKLNSKPSVPKIGCKEKVFVNNIKVTNEKEESSI